MVELGELSEGNAMFDGRWRDTVDRGTGPVGRRLQKVGITADMLTATGLVSAAATAVAVATGHLHLAILLLILTGLHDLLDGPVAKASGTSSTRGAFFDSVTDRVSDARYQATPPRISASDTRSVTESKNAPRVDEVPDALATGPSSRSWRPVRISRRMARWRCPVATATAVAAADTNPVAVSMSAVMPTFCSLRPTGPVPRPTVSRQRPDRGHDQAGIRFPVDPGDVDVQLDLVPVRVQDVEAVGHRVVAGAHDRH